MCIRDRVSAVGIFQDGMTATPEGTSEAPLLVPLLLADPESCIPVVRLSNFHQLIGEKDILVSGVPKLNKVET